MRLLVEKTDAPGLVLGKLREAGAGATYATLLDVSATADPARWMGASPGSSRIVLRCADPGPVDPPLPSVSEPVGLPASWSASGWAEFDQRTRAAHELGAARGIELLIRPSARGMLSDAVCTRSWAHRTGGRAGSLLLDPIGWIVPSMLADIEDHLTRIGEIGLQCPAVGGVLIRSARLDEHGALIETTLAEGDIDPGLIADRLGPLARSTKALAALDRADLDRF